MNTTKTTKPKSAVPRLRPYQREVALAITRSVRRGLGRTFTVEIARQGGKNEISAQVELYLLTKYSLDDAEVIKCAPTFRPQLRLSMRRLWMRMQQQGSATFSRQRDQTIEFGSARVLFLSAEPAANVVGHTASLLLEVDEAQDVDEEKFDREFRPMAATTNATTVLYGTAWDDRTLLERTKQHNLELQRRDGIRRHFEYDWQHVARHNPKYGEYVETERLRLGDTHPMYLTQYCLKPIAGGGRFFTTAQRAQLTGDHSRERHPTPGEAYVAGLDLAGGDEAPVAPDLRADPSQGTVDTDSPYPTASNHDSTVLTIGRLVYPPSHAAVQEPRVEIVEHYAWTGDPHETLLPQIIDLLRIWKIGRVAVDATGLGETAARLIAQALGQNKVTPIKFTVPSKSQLGFDLLAAANGGRLKMYRSDGSQQSSEFWRQCERARAAYRANQTLNFYVDPTDGHDDYLTSAALLIHASRAATRRTAMGSVRVGM